MNLKNKTIAILIAPKFQDDETVRPARFLTDLGADVKYVGLQKGTCSGKGQTSVEVDSVIGDVHPNQFDGVIIPGGAAPEALRLNKDVLEFIRTFMDEAKPVAAICHGPQVLISAGVTQGRFMTSVAGIRDDLINSGARFLDQEVVVDNNLVTSRTPQDIPAFNKTFAEILAKYDQENAPWVHATPSQVIEYAIMNEIRAFSLYEDLSKRAKDKLAKAKFKFLAESERAHREILTDIFEKMNPGRKPVPREMGSGTGEGTGEIDPDGDLLKILRAAISAEESAFHLYAEISDKAKNSEAKKIFQCLSAEELEHKRILEAEYALRSGRCIPSAVEKEPYWSQDLW